MPRSASTLFLFFCAPVSVCDAWNSDAPSHRRTVIRDVVGSAMAVPACAVAWNGSVRDAVPCVPDEGATLKYAQESGEVASSSYPLRVVSHPETYQALAYEPSRTHGDDGNRRDCLPPLILVLHGAGRNDRDIFELSDMSGEHAGLVPSLVASGRAPATLTDNFAVLAPYSYGRRSFYEEPRDKLLSFLEWAGSDAGRKDGCPLFDTRRVFLFGFSDGATVAVELLTTRRFAAAVIASYGFTGRLPDRAVERLKGLSVWVFHSADDRIFPVSASDNLVGRLRDTGTKNGDGTGAEVVRYSRYDSDPENFRGRVRGHTTGITASKSDEVYRWLLEVGTHELR